MSNLLSMALDLIVRVDVGSDNWGAPKVEEETYPVRGYLRLDSADQNEATGVAAASGKVYFTAPATVIPQTFHAVEQKVEGQVYRFEFTGAPVPKFSTAGPTPRLDHWEAAVALDGAA